MLRITEQTGGCDEGVALGQMTLRRKGGRGGNLGRMTPTLELLGVACSQIFNQGLPGVLGTPLAWGELGPHDAINRHPPPPPAISSK